MSYLRLLIEDFFDAEPCNMGVEYDFMPYFDIEVWKVPRWHQHTYGEVLPNFCFKPPKNKKPRKLRKWLYYNERAPWLCWLLGAGRDHLPRGKNWYKFFDEAFDDSPKHLEYMDRMPTWLQEELVYWAVKKSLTYPDVLDAVIGEIENCNYAWYMSFVRMGYCPIWDRSVARYDAREVGLLPIEQREEALQKLFEKYSRRWDFMGDLEVVSLYKENLNAQLRRWCVEGEIQGQKNGNTRSSRSGEKLD